MTGPIIPAELWPEPADAIVWDSDGQSLELRLFGSDWGLVYTQPRIDMPSGHDWRVPMMRPQSALAPAAAPAIDLEQFRMLAQGSIDALTQKRLYTSDVDAAVGYMRHLLALIAGQANVRSSSEQCSEVASSADETITWGTQYPGKAIKLFGTREIAEWNWYPDEGADLVGLRVVERVQPTKGDGM